MAFFDETSMLLNVVYNSNSWLIKQKVFYIHFYATFLKYKQTPISLNYRYDQQKCRQNLHVVILSFNHRHEVIKTILNLGKRSSKNAMVAKTVHFA